MIYRSLAILIGISICYAFVPRLTVCCIGILLLAVIFQSTKEGRKIARRARKNAARNSLIARIEQRHGANFLRRKTQRRGKTKKELADS